MILLNRKVYNKLGGIYSISNNINSKIYIGSTIRIDYIDSEFKKYIDNKNELYSNI